MGSQNALGSVATVIVAAGKGTRAGGDTRSLPKQYRHVAGVPVLAKSASVFHNHPSIGRVVVVIAENDRHRFEALDLSPNMMAVTGGDSRQESVLAGLRALSDDPPDIVLIHDAARPFVTPDLIEALLDVLSTADGAIPLLPMTDTIKRTGDGGHIIETLDRRELGAAQTPQAFHYARILDAHERAQDDTEASFTDDAAVGVWGGLLVTTVAGNPENFKLTTPEDFARAEHMLEGSQSMDTRTGQGFDVHRFVDGDEVVLGGVAIPYRKSLSGHSDADVLMHAITDALLGAIGDGDIGTHFPPSDDAWKGADSSIFLRDAVSRVDNAGGTIVNVDATVMCEKPKIGPHRDAIRARLAELTNIEPSRVSIKATTTERLGFTGREEGIAAMAIATVKLPV